jgi:hypothetical protein
VSVKTTGPNGVQLNVIGPDLGEVGASENFTAVPQAGRWILSGLMLVGRLEIFTVLVLLTPAFLATERGLIADSYRCRFPVAAAATPLGISSSRGRLACT